MDERFDKGAWERHWRAALEAGRGTDDIPNPYLLEETAGLHPGIALDAGCGTGADAVALAQRGWAVTGADIAPSALATATARADRAGVTVAWVEADLTVWAPDTPFDLVTTAYAHAAIPQLQLYRRLAGWVAPGGTLLIVGHSGSPAAEGHGDRPPESSTVVTAGITAPLVEQGWRIRTASERTAAVPGHPVRHHDVVVRAERPSA